MLRHLLLGIALLSATAFASAAEFREELAQAMESTNPLQDELDDLMVNGRLPEANARLLAVFPQETRTAVQCQLLGNMIYSADPALSYRLHQEAFRLRPDETEIQLEWGLQQHRAGEHAGALTAYDLFSEKHPDYAPVHGLAAGCLIHLGRTADAVARWKKSEEAKTGSLKNLESLIYAISPDHDTRLRRQRLHEQASGGDGDAMIRLIVLDSGYPFDWWNVRPHRSNLAADFQLLDRFPDDKRLPALRCLSACNLLARKEDDKEQDFRKPFIEHALILDDAHTLAPDHALNDLLIAAAIRHEVITKSDAKTWFGERLLAAAQTSTDATLWNLVGYLLDDDPRLTDIESAGWKATGDERFALGRLVIRQREDKLPADDPELLAAVAQFPDSSEVALIQVRSNMPDPDMALLIRAIKTEYRSLSSANPAGFVHRQGAWALRAYFTMLAKLMP